MADISVQELHERRAKGDAPRLIDVREPYEYELANLGGELLPLGSLPDRLPDLESHRNKELVLMCRSGARSGSATQFLQQQGFAHVRNLTGGILAWKASIDPSLNVS